MFNNCTQMKKIFVTYFSLDISLFRIFSMFSIEWFSNSFFFFFTYDILSKLEKKAILYIKWQKEDMKYKEFNLCYGSFPCGNGYRIRSSKMGKILAGTERWFYRKRLRIP